MNQTVADEYEYSDEIKIKGEAIIKIDDRIVAKCENKWTRWFMASLVEIVGWTGKLTAGSIAYYAYTTSGPTARVGRDTSTPTSKDMTDLAQRIDIAPSSVTRRWIRDTDNWRWISQWEFIWNPDVLPTTTIGEAGIWFSSSSDGWTSPYTNTISYSSQHGSILYEPAGRLCVRVSVADGDFSPIDYVYTQTLSFVWRLIIKP